MNHLSFWRGKTLSIVLAICLGGILVSFTTLPNFSLKESFSGFFSNHESPITNHQPPPFMKYDFDRAWREIDSLEQQGLPKSALEKTEALLDAARSEKMPAQQIKALIYRGKFQSQLEEEGMPKAIYRFEQEIEKAEFPVKAIMQSMLAEMYQGYLDNNYWRFQNRTQTGEYKPDDLRTWSIEQLTKESSRLYWASLADPKLKSTDIGDFKILLTDGKNEEGLRPTLFDFLAHRAIDYFMNERNYLTQPAYKFYIDSEKAFAPVGEFVRWNIETQDTASQKLQTLLLMQDLLKFRLSKNDNKAALLDADLKRLQFVYNNAVLDTKETVYLKALENLQKQHDGTPSEAEVMFQMASYYNNAGASYQPAPMGSPQMDEERKWYIKKAHDLCQQAIEKYPGSFGAKQCAVLKASILEKQLDMQLEMVNLPEQPFLAKIDYRNTPEAWIKVIRFDEKRRQEFEKLQAGRDANDRILDYFNQLKPIKNWSVKLPDDGDFRRHSVETKMDGLPCGQYLVLVAGNSNFSKTESAVGYLFTNVSEIGYWQRMGGSEGISFVVFDRKTGTPTKGVTGEFWVQNYNSVFRKYDWKKKGTGVSDANGFINPGLNENEDRNFRILLRNGKDTLFTQENYYNYTYRENNQRYQQTHFFLDRAIYRPGQTVFFKGIALDFDEKQMPSILKNQAVIITFKDANWQDVSSLQLKTNEYGTFSGQFTAPKSGLLGNMQIQSSIGGNSKNFRVEEYKRPKFEVAFEPIQGTYRLEDSVKITGNAVAYAGSNIDGAQVTWRVVREVRFPWWPWWYAKWFPWRGETMEIANGVTATDEAGKFNITFAALPDRSIPKDKKPEFNYTIYADVTDITGETQSNETYVAVGYISMKVDATANGKALDNTSLNLDSLSKLELVTQNLAGQFEPAQGNIKLELLKAPSQVYLDRYWEQPDRQVLSEKEFKQTFPKFAWGNENEPQNWPVASTVLASTFDTKTNKEVNLPKAKMTAGWYALTLNTTDKYGEKVEVKKYFSTYDLDEKKLPAPAIAWHILEKPTWEPGQIAPLYFGTSEKSLSVLLEMEKDGKTLSRKWLKVSDLLKENYAVKEEDRGNVSYLYSWAMHNRTAPNASVIQVPWSNKDLTIEYGTFRDKLLPGQKEEWTVKIKGPKGEKVAAEMVAGMYDASLDAFAPNAWGLGVWPSSWTRIRYNAGGYQAIQQNWLGYPTPPVVEEGDYRQYRALNWFNWYFNDYGGRMYMTKSRAYDMADGVMMMEAAPAAAPREEAESMKREDVAVNGIIHQDNAQGGDEEQKPSKPETDLSQVQVRTNLNETVFFYPHLMTDEEGNVVIKFTMNEALTRWKFLGLATTPDLKIGTTMKEVVTQKDLMVLPNPPRFFRENDEIEFTAKVSNLTENALSGDAKLELVNALTGEKLDWSKITNVPQTINFTADGKQSARLAWRFKVPDIADVPMIEHTVIAAAGAFSDAERSAAPVLSNRMLVTETLPLPVRGNETKVFTLNSLKNNSSNTLRHEALMLEFTQNPAWYAVQALPYLMEYPYECTEQIFARYYANSLATSVANSHPKIKGVFDKWRNYEPAALQSNLSKNEELKTALLEETPWVLAAQSEEQQKQNIALLFDLNRMAYEQEAALKKMQDRQLPGGGWAWFPGGVDSWYITQYITAGLGHLQKLGVQDLENNPAAWQMVEKAVLYCDARMVEHYENLEDLVKKGKAKWEDDHLDYLVSHYLYTRSFFLEDKSAQASTGRSPLGGRGSKRYIALDGKISQVHDYYMGQADKYWLNKGIYTEGMLSLALNRTGKAATAQKIVRSLKERSLNNDELGMYWKYPTGWWWYQAPIETHSLMIEVFNDVANDTKAVDDLKVWLLKNKQTNHWKTTKATSEAVYALLSSGDNWLLEDQPLKITLPNAANSKLEQQVKTAQQTAEAGTGYFKTRIAGENVDKNMATVQVHNPNKVVAWGAMYWQYFEQLDKIKTFEETPLTIKKQLFRVENSATGEVLKPIQEGEALKVGEKLKVRIELRVDRDMEYVHMKDMRASAFEPINVLSQYKWQGGLGYYESTRDASTNFFFSYLPKGTHVFEYPLRVTYNGDFSNGITTIQCMYAPEFTSHSEGIRVKVK